MNPDRPLVRFSFWLRAFRRLGGLRHSANDATGDPVKDPTTSQCGVVTQYAYVPHGNPSAPCHGRVFGVVWQESARPRVEPAITYYCCDCHCGLPPIAYEKDDPVAHDGSDWVDDWLVAGKFAP